MAKKKVIKDDVKKINVKYTGAAKREAFGFVWNTGDVNEIPARFEGSIDEAMESIEGKGLGFKIVK